MLKNCRGISKIVGVIAATKNCYCRGGPKKKRNAKEWFSLHTLNEKYPWKSSSASKEDLKEHGINISSSIVWRRLLLASRSAYQPIKKQLLNQPMKKSIICGH